MSAAANATEDTAVEAAEERAAAEEIESDEAVTSKQRLAELKAMRADEIRDLHSYLQELGGGASVRFTVIRMRPKSWGQHHIGGTLDTYHEPISEQDIRDSYGGGAYQIKISRMSDKGRWQFFTSKTIEIAGDPKIDGLVKSSGGSDQPPPSSNGASAVVDRAMAAMEKTTSDALQRAESAQKNSGMDMVMLEAMQAPLRESNAQLRDQLAQATREMADLRQQLLEKMSAPPPRNEFQEKVLSSMVDGQEARISAVRAQHESEVRMLKESHRDELKDQRRQHSDELKRLEDRHAREVSTIQNAHQMASGAISTSTEMRTDVLKMDIDRLNRELTEARAELATLRAKKDKPLLEQVSEMNAIKEALGADGDGDKSVWEKVAAVAAESPILAKLVGVGDDEPVETPADVEQQQMMPPENVPFQAPDGNIYVRRGQQMIQVDPATLRRQRAGQARSGESGGDATDGAPRAPTKGDVAAAVAFMENALRNGTSAESFAQTARSLVPGDILAYLEHVGVDKFLDDVAKLKKDSPLRTQKGRGFARDVHQYLISGTTSDTVE